MKVCIASSRPREIGDRCLAWAKENPAPDVQLVENPRACDVFISVLYDQRVDPNFIAKRRCYNFHPGLLPHYRGCGIYSWVLINRERDTGVTLHEIDYSLDTGAIIETVKTPITEYDTAESLFRRCMDLLYGLFTAYLHRLVASDYVTRPNQGGHLYLKRDLEKAKDISHIIRAFTFRGKESAFWCDRRGAKHYVR